MKGNSCFTRNWEPTIIATHEYVVPKSMPMTSPTSELFHLAIRDVVEPEEIDTEKSGVACVIFLLIEEVRPRRRHSWSDIIILC
jgi:hypothetical protein